MAGGEKDQRQRPVGVAQGCGQLPGADGNGFAVFVFEFDAAGAAVAGEVQHMKGVGGEGLADFVRVAHFENLDLGVAVAAGHIHCVENALEFGFQVEYGAAGLAFVRGADGDENLQRPGLGRVSGLGGVDHPAQHGNGRVQRRHAPIRQAGGFEGQAQQGGVGAGEDELQFVADRKGVEPPGDVVAHRTGKQHRAQQLAKAGERLAEGQGGCVAGAAERGGVAAVEELGEVLQGLRGQREAAELGNGRAVVVGDEVERAGRGRRSKLDFDPVAGGGGGRWAEGWPRGGAADGIDDGVEFVDATPGPGAQKRRNGGFGIDHDRDQAFAILDHLESEGCNFGAEPGAVVLLAGEEHEPDLAFVEPFVHLGDDVVARLDLPLVEPGVDAGLPQPGGKLPDGRFIYPPVTAEHRDRLVLVCAIHFPSLRDDVGEDSAAGGSMGRCSLRPRLDEDGLAVFQAFHLGQGGDGDVQGFDVFAAVLEALLHHEARAQYVGAGFAGHLDEGGGGAAVGEEVIDDHHPLAGADVAGGDGQPRLGALGGRGDAAADGGGFHVGGVFLGVHHRHAQGLGDDQRRGDAAGFGGEDHVGLEEGQPAGKLVGQLEDEAGFDAVVEEVVDDQHLAVDAALGFDAADEGGVGGGEVEVGAHDGALRETAVAVPGLAGTLTLGR